MKKTERIMHRAPRSAARASRARTAMCDSNGKCVPGRKLVSGTHNSVIYQSLRSLCTSCTTFSEFILGLLLNTVLFLKKNFNLKTPVTHVTHCGTTINPHFSCGTSVTHPVTHLSHIALYLSHNKNIELFVDHNSRISNTMSTNHENRLTLRDHRSVSSISTQ